MKDFSFRTGPMVDLEALARAAQHVGAIGRTSACAAHRLRTAMAWDARNDVKRDDHITEARVLLVQMRDVAVQALAELDAATNPEPPVPPAVAQRADMFAIACAITGADAQTERAA